MRKDLMIEILRELAREQRVTSWFLDDVHTAEEIVIKCAIATEGGVKTQDIQAEGSVKNQEEKK